MGIYSANEKKRRQDIFLAVTRGDLIRLKELLEGDFNTSVLLVPAELACYCTPIAEAARLGHLKLIQELAPYYENTGYLESGCPLHIACKFGSVKVVEFLVEKFPKFVNKVDCQQQLLPIQLAALENDAELVHILVKAGANINQTFTSSCRNAVDKCNSPNFFGRFNNMSTDPHRYPALFLAIWNNCADAATCLLENGADTILEVESMEEGYLKEMTQAVGNKIYAISVAAFRNSHECLGILLNHAMVDENVDGRAVYVALIRGNVQCFELLLKNGAPTPTLDRFSEDEMTNLWCEILSPHVTPYLVSTDTIEMLLRSGTSMAPLVSIDSDRLCNVLIDAHGSVLEWILSMGLFELRYLKHYQNGGSEACSKLKKQDYSSLMKCFTYYQDFGKLDLIFDHFPDELKIDLSSDLAPSIGKRRISHMIFDELCDDEDWGIVNTLVIDQAPYEQVPKACSLLRISKWRIRSQYVEKYGFVPYMTFPQLQIPVTLGIYLRRGVCHRSRYLQQGSIFN